MYVCAACGNASKDGRHWCQPYDAAVTAPQKERMSVFGRVSNWRKSRVPAAKRIEDAWHALGGPISRPTAELMAMAGKLRIDPDDETTVVPDGEPDVRDTLRAMPTIELIGLAGQHTQRVRNQVTVSPPKSLSPEAIREALGLSAFLNSLVNDELLIRKCLWCGRMGQHLYACNTGRSPSWHLHSDGDDFDLDD